MADYYNNNDQYQQEDDYQPENYLVKGAEDQMEKVYFLQRLYFWLVIQYILIGVTCYCAYKFSDFSNFLKNEISFTIVFFCIGVITLLVTYFGKPKTNKIPLNLVCFILFTAGLAFTFAWIVVKGHPQICLMVFLTTGLIIMALFGSVMTTKSDLTYQSATLFIVGALLLSFNIFMIFTSVSFFLIIFVTLGLSLFAFFLVYATQTNIAGSKRLRTNDDPISGAVLIYIDFFVMIAKTCDLLRQLIIRERS